MKQKGDQSRAYKAENRDLEKSKNKIGESQNKISKP